MSRRLALGLIFFGLSVSIWGAAVLVPDRTARLDIPDGIYQYHHHEAAKGGAGWRVRYEGGGKEEIRLVKLITDKFGSATMTSLNNDNTHARLHLTKVGPIPEGVKTVALVIAGRCFLRQWKSSPNGDGFIELAAEIKGAEEYVLFAQALTPELKRRNYPGHRFAVTYRPDQATYRLGEPVTLTFEVKNVGNVPICFQTGGKNRGLRNNRFRFSAHLGSKPIPEKDVWDFGGLSNWSRLKLGETYTESVRLDHWFNFAEPGSYKITGTYELPLLAFDRTTSDVIWDDRAVGECVVEIEGPNRR